MPVRVSIPKACLMQWLKLDVRKSYIAITGLGSRPLGLWKERGPDTNYMWLRDSLPKDIPCIKAIIFIGNQSVQFGARFCANSLELTLVNEFTKMLENISLAMKCWNLVEANIPTVASFRRHPLSIALYPQ